MSIELFIVFKILNIWNDYIHPGGNRVIYLMVGKDITDYFHANHFGQSETNKINKILKIFYIGIVQDLQLINYIEEYMLLKYKYLQLG